MRPTPPPAEPATWDPAAKWIRVLEVRPDGLVELEFAVGDPRLFVELVLPRPAFEEFCATHGVAPTSGPLAPVDDGGGGDARAAGWSLRQARTHRLGHPT